MKTRVKTREHPIRQTNLKRNQRPQVESLGAGQRQSPRTQEDGPGKGLGSPMRQEQRLKQIWSANRRWDQRAEQV